jgi:hypothetical protein
MDIGTGCREQKGGIETRACSCKGEFGIVSFCTKPWYVRLWTLMTNPFRYVITGEVRW